MAEREIIHYIKTENNPELLYLVAVTCIERLVKLERGSLIKAILDAGTNALYKMTKKN